MENLSSLILLGDSLKMLLDIPNCSVQAVVTSPPYWGLRSAHLKDEIGGEDNLEDYLSKLKMVFLEIHRVLKPSGVCWVNLGDVYSSGNRKYRATDKKNLARGVDKRPCDPPGIKEKNLIGVPWRFAFMLQEMGFFLRSEVIWHKFNSMPESVKDRPIRRHEHLFMVSKSAIYYFERSCLGKYQFDASGSVWRIPTQPSKIKGHSSTFPDEIVKPCIEASSKIGDIILDPFAGSLTVGRVCAQLGRSFIGVEINEKYVNQAIEIWPDSYISPVVVAKCLVDHI